MRSTYLGGMNEEKSIELVPGSMQYYTNPVPGTIGKNRLSVVRIGTKEEMVWEYASSPMPKRQATVSWQSNHRIKNEGV